MLLAEERRLLVYTLRSVFSQQAEERVTILYDSLDAEKGIDRIGDWFVGIESDVRNKWHIFFRFSLGINQPESANEY